MADYGAFVELEEGVEGLVHISEMSWTRKLRHPSQMVHVDDEVEVLVLGVDPDKKRISLGMKQIKPNPWDVVAEKYPEGTILEGGIKNITEFGVFIGIEEGIDGLIHVSDISWTKKIRHPSEVYKSGDVVQAKVLTVDKENEKFTLGIKQLKEDPWTQVPIKYPVGQVISGTVTNITDFGLFVEVEEGIEGLVHVSEISRRKIKSPSDVYKEGDVIEAKVIHVSADERRLGLSVKQTKEETEKKRPGGKGYSAGSGTNAGGNSLGDLLREKLEAANGEEVAGAIALDTPAEEVAAKEAPAEKAAAKKTKSKAPAKKAAPKKAATKKAATKKAAAKEAPAEEAPAKEAAAKEAPVEEAAKADATVEETPEPEVEKDES